MYMLATFAIGRSVDKITYDNIVEKSFTNEHAACWSLVFPKLGLKTKNRDIFISLSKINKTYFICYKLLIFKC